MKIKWLGHASFFISSNAGVRIVTDPYEPGYKGIISYGPMPDPADVVTISHEHGDHNYAAGVKGNPTVLRRYGWSEAKGVVFMGHPTFHDRVKGSERGPNVVFCFNLDGINMCHLGDLGHPLTDSQIAELGQVDVLLIATGGPSATCDLDVAHDVCTRIYPRMIIPMHFKNEKATFPKYRAEDFIKGRNNARMLEVSEIEVTREDLPPGMEIVVLKAAL